MLVSPIAPLNIRQARGYTTPFNVKANISLLLSMYVLMLEAFYMFTEHTSTFYVSVIKVHRTLSHFIRRRQRELI